MGETSTAIAEAFRSRVREIGKRILLETIYLMADTLGRIAMGDAPGISATHASEAARSR